MLYWEGEVNNTALLTKLSPWKDYDFKKRANSPNVSAANWVGISGVRSLVTGQDGHRAACCTLNKQIYGVKWKLSTLAKCSNILTCQQPLYNDILDKFPK
jgi:hypothetical protein